MMLRGFDDYEVTLGDEMRGERASLGKSIAEAERDLRIKADVLRAIEDCDLDGFPNDSVVAGYVRSYGRYLGMDPDECYHRFCAESGFRSPSAAFGGPSRPARRGGMKDAMAAGAALGTGLTQSRFAMRRAPVHLGTRVSLGGFTSAGALMMLIVGLGYGGYALLQDIQRVGIAPLPEAPEVVAKAPLITTPTVDGTLITRPDAEVYQGGGALAAAAPIEMPPPVLPARDGPISAIDPATSGVYQDPVHELAAREAGEDAGPDRDRGPDAAIAVGAVALPERLAAAAPVTQPAVTKGQVVIHATDPAWIRVRDGEAAVIFEGTLGAGDRFEVPERVKQPVLRTGNAGAVYLLVDGTPYGPIGLTGRVVGNLSLKAIDVAGQIPQATAGSLGAGTEGAVAQRADATLQQ